MSTTDGNNFYQGATSAATIGGIPGAAFIATHGLSAGLGALAGVGNIVGTFFSGIGAAQPGWSGTIAAPSAAATTNPTPHTMVATAETRPPGGSFGEVQEGLPRYQDQGGAPGITGEGGQHGAGSGGPTGRGPFNPGPYVQGGGLSPLARGLLRPIFDRFGYDVARTRIVFDSSVSTANTNGDLIRINPDLWSNPKWNNYKRMQLLTHEVTHSVQFQNLGSGAMRWRLGVERVTHVFGDVYDVPNQLADTPLSGINVVDPRFTLEGIAARMEDFARTVPP